VEGDGRFVKGEIVAEKGMVSDGVFFILKGKISISHQYHSEVMIMNYEEGSFFGQNFLLGEPYHRTYR
jgi:signal-transduction protein with cAMP-binding, CBS, and nucleotidyltransferase domain